MAGNANSGRRKQTYITDALMMEIKAREAEGDKAGLRRMAVKIMDLAETGERWAAEYVRDTIDGKPMQQVEISGDEENPLATSIAIRYIKPDGTGH